MEARAIATTVVFFLFCLPATAQPVPPKDDALETVVVTGHALSPAMWLATKGDAQVTILAIVEPLPNGFQWNSKPLETALTGAHELLLPARADVPFFPGLWFLLTKRSLLHPPDGKTLWDLLSPGVAARFAAARDLLREDKNHYDDFAPGPAALKLESDFRHVYMLTTHEPEDRIRFLARTRGVRTRKVATYDAIPSVEELLALPAATVEKCVDAAVRDVETQSAHAGPAAEAWAAGNVAGMLANWSEPRLYDCILELSVHANELDRRAIDDTVEDIRDALDFGGHSVAVVDVGLLLRKDGVLDRLRATGISFSRPPA